MKNVLVTGANKGIGRAICLKLLRDFPDIHVLLASRSVERGIDAANTILSEVGTEMTTRIQVIHLDVTDDHSIAQAVADVRSKFPTLASPLYGLINNAGIGTSEDPQMVVKTNVSAVKHMCDAFLPLLDPSIGRIVNVASGAAPMFVEKLSASDQEFYVTPQTWAAIEDKISSVSSTPAYDKHTVYGFSKALLNVYTLSLAHQHPQLCITSCTPGFILTDMTRTFGATNPPEKGTIAPLFCLLGDAQSGCYYGSDAVRSPLNKYRAPGDPAYEP